MKYQTMVRKLENKINDDNMEEVIPEQILNNLVPQEEILFKLRTKKILKSSIAFDIMIISSIIIGVIIIFSNIEKLSFEILGITLFLIIFLIIIIIIFKKIKLYPHDKTCFLCITNRKLYLHTREGRLDVIDAIDLGSVKAIIYKKKKEMGNNTDIGTIEFISDFLKDPQKKRLTFHNFHNLSENLKIIETILWNYGNVLERWNSLMNNYNIEIPHKFKISTEAKKRLSKHHLYSNIFIYGGITITIIGIILFPLIPLDIDNDLNFFMKFGLLVIGPIFSIIFLILKFSNLRWRGSKYKTLTLGKDNIILSGENFTNSLQFSPDLYLNYKVSQIFKKTSRDSIRFFGALEIRQDYNSSEKLLFGPIDDFFDFLEIIYLFLIIWKVNQGYLLSKEQVFNQEESSLTVLESDLNIDEKVKPLQVYTKFKPISLPDEILQPIQNYLNPNETILHTFKPENKIKWTVIKVIIGIISTIVLFNVPSIFDFMPVGLSILLGGLLFIGSFLGIVLLCTIPGVLTVKSFLSVFTDQKIIIKRSNKITTILYSNISSIKRVNQIFSYNIEVTLKKQIENNPFADKNSVGIVRIPKDNDLYLKIIEIRDIHYNNQ